MPAQRTRPRRCQHQADMAARGAGCATNDLQPHSRHATRSSLRWGRARTLFSTRKVPGQRRSGRNDRSEGSIRQSGSTRRIFGCRQSAHAGTTVRETGSTLGRARHAAGCDGSRGCAGARPIETSMGLCSYGLYSDGPGRDCAGVPTSSLRCNSPCSSTMLPTSPPCVMAPYSYGPI